MKTITKSMKTTIITPAMSQRRNRFARVLCMLLLVLPLMVVIVLADDIPNIGGSLTDTVENAAYDIAGWIVGISTPVAIIGVGAGVIMMKSTEQQKISQGKMIRNSSIIGWGILNGIGLILGQIQSYIGNSGTP